MSEQIMSLEQFAYNVAGYKRGHGRVSGAEFEQLNKDYALYRSEAVKAMARASVPNWVADKDARGGLIRKDLNSGIGMAITNSAGNQILGESADVMGFGDDMGGGAQPAVKGIGALAQQFSNGGGVPVVRPAASNAVQPVNVNPVMPQVAPAAAAEPAPQAAPAGPRRVAMTAAEFEAKFGRKVAPGAAFPYRDKSGAVVATIEVQ